MNSALLWIPITLVASGAQVLRTGAQASLTRSIGTLGATQVRFVFGLPFALVFLFLVSLWQGSAVPSPNATVLGWSALGALAQIGGTALMLAVMQRRAFSVAYAYIKTEPVLVAVMGFVLLGDRLAPLGWLAVAVVTLGVLIASTKAGEWRALLGEGRMIAAGVAAGGLFGLSAIAFRGGISALGQGEFLLRSLTVLAISLTIQAGVLALWLALRDRAAFTGSLRVWRTSLGAGFLGAFASACWFTAFSLTPAANVRTLGLIEMPIAAALAGRLTGTSAQRREVLGLGIVMVGLALLLAPLAA